MNQKPSSFEVKLPVFTGPLDLLLHLVQKEEVSIWDVSLAKVTEEYMSYLATMQKLNLEVTCEFLVVAATLLEIKSRSLLPKPSVASKEEEEDVRENLIKRLLEYKKFKLAAANFSQRAQKESTVFTKTYEDPWLADDEPPVVTVQTGASVWDLLEIVQKMFVAKKVELEAKGKPQVPRKQVSLTETILKLRQRFQRGYRCSFKALLGEAGSKEELIVTFLASLELVRLGVVNLVRDSRQEIYLVAEG